ncbi:MAG: hypothetical protein QOJ49_723 [Actinomycetota bacterium]|nr:hypothetical protein [Actinomycetota bacterium]
MARSGRTSPLRTTPTLIALGGLLAALGASLAGTSAAALGASVANESAIDGGGGRGFAALWGPDSRVVPVERAAVGQRFGPVAGPVSRPPGASVGGVPELAGSGLLSGTVQVALGSGPVDIPARVLSAYRAAAAEMSRADSSCHLTWPLLAGIGRIESGHARGGAIDGSGRTLSPILGPVLDGGSGFAAIPDTDNGRFDGDPVWDRAVGPMQFIPSSWARYGRDGNGDGRADPHNVDDAALAAAAYLCAGDRDLRDTAQLRRAVFGYNHSWDYVATVLAWARAYAGGGSVAAPVGGGGGGGGAIVLASGRGSSSAERRPTARSRPTASAQPSPSATPTPTPTPTSTSVPSTSPTPSETPTPTTSPTPSEMPTPTPTTSPTGCPADTATPTPTASDGSTATPTPTPTLTPTVPSTADSSASPTPSGTESPDPCATVPTPTVSSTTTTPSPRAVEGP